MKSELILCQLASALAIVGIAECVLVNIVPWNKYVEFEEAKADFGEDTAA